MQQGERLRVLVVDDEVQVREMLTLNLQLDEAFTVVGEAGSADEAVDAAYRLQPDVVLLDIRMPGGEGLNAIPRIHAAAPDAQVIVLSALPESERGHEAVAMGADGYLEKGRALGDLGGWLRTLRAGWEATPRSRE